ncbi:hypothetical protein MTO96_035224 [Rhipicephalus appendiculatus]
MYWRTFQLQASLRLAQNVLPRAVRTVSTPRVLCAAHIHTSRSRRDAHPQGRSFVLQNPFRWLSLFLDFMYLKNQWDPDFNRSEFLEGTKQAISTVLSLIATQRLDDLAGLVKREAVNQFIPGSLTGKVTLQSIVDHKYCDIQMQFIVVKNLEKEQASSDVPRILMCFIYAKFHLRAGTFAEAEEEEVSRSTRVRASVARANHPRTSVDNRPSRPSAAISRAWTACPSEPLKERLLEALRWHSSSTTMIVEGVPKELQHGMPPIAIATLGYAEPRWNLYLVVAVVGAMLAISGTFLAPSGLRSRDVRDSCYYDDATG